MTPNGPDIHYTHRSVLPSDSIRQVPSYKQMRIQRPTARYYTNRETLENNNLNGISSSNPSPPSLPHGREDRQSVGAKGMKDTRKQDPLNHLSKAHMNSQKSLYFVSISSLCSLVNSITYHLTIFLIPYDSWVLTKACSSCICITSLNPHNNPINTRY